MTSLSRLGIALLTGLAALAAAVLVPDGPPGVGVVIVAILIARGSERMLALRIGLGW